LRLIIKVEGEFMIDKLLETFNKSLGSLSNIWTILVAGNLLYLALYWRQKMPTWKEALKAIPIAIINYGFFFLTPTISKLAAKWVYQLLYGQSPSILDVFAWAKYHNAENKVLEYAATYGQMAIIPLGLKASCTLVELGENMITNVYDRVRGKKADPVEQVAESSTDMSLNLSAVVPGTTSPRK
jgi:hypothetical protein